MSNLNAEVVNFGNTLATVLDYPHCPSIIREAVKTHLAEVYRQADLTRPEIIRVLYALVAPTPAAETLEPSATPEATGAAPVEELVAEPLASAAEPKEEVSSEIVSAAIATNAEDKLESAIEWPTEVQVKEAPPGADLRVIAAADSRTTAATTEGAATEAAEVATATSPAEESIPTRISTSQEMEGAEPAKEEFAITGEFGVNGASQQETVQLPA